jgi:hypothetical protein
MIKRKCRWEHQQVKLRNQYRQPFVVGAPAGARGSGTIFVSKDGQYKYCGRMQSAPTVEPVLMPVLRFELRTVLARWKGSIASTRSALTVSFS